MVIPYVFIVVTIKFDEAYVLTYEQFKEIYDKEGDGIYEYKYKYNYADIKNKDLKFYNQLTNYGKKERMSIPDELAQAQLKRERKERDREYGNTCLIKNLISGLRVIIIGENSVFFSFVAQE